MPSVLKGGARLRRLAARTLALAWFLALAAVSSASAAPTIVSFTAHPAYVRVPERSMMTATAEFGVPTNTRVCNGKT